MMMSSSDIDMVKQQQQGEDKDSSPDSRALDEVDDIIEDFLDSDRITTTSRSSHVVESVDSTASARRASSSSVAATSLPTYNPHDPRLQPRPFNPLLDGPTRVMNGINLGTIRWQPPRGDTLQDEFLRMFSPSSREPNYSTSLAMDPGLSSSGESNPSHHYRLQHDFDYSNFSPGGIESSLTDTKIHVNLNARSLLSTSRKRRIHGASSEDDSKYTAANEDSKISSDPFLSSAVSSAIGFSSGSNDKQAHPIVRRRRSSSTKESQIRNKEWNLRYEELITYKATYGDCLVPYNWPQNKQLANWVKRQRYQYNQMKQFNQHTTLTEKRIDMLNSIGFTWNSHDASWEDKYKLLLVFHREHGHVNVPPNYNQNRCGLATWVKYQRRLYKILMSKKDNGDDNDNGSASGDDGSLDDRDTTVSGSSNKRPSSAMAPAPAPTLTKDRLQKLKNLGFNFDPCDRLKKNKKQKR